MTCHFVYARPQCGILQKVYCRMALRAQRLGIPLSPYGSRENPDTSRWPHRSPYANTAKIFELLSRRMPVKLYSLEEHVRCDFREGDLFIGHPSFPYRDGRVGVTELSIDARPGPKVAALISPLHCQADIASGHIDRPYLEAVGRLLEKADVLFAIMGQYWWDRWPSSEFGHWVPKMVRLDMAIDTVDFPRVKEQFNPPGQRGFLYIGMNDPMKGLSFFSELMRQMPGTRCGWIGSGPEVEGVPRISGPRELSADFMRQVAKDYDVFISPSVADPNPTTILESMSWGFPVVCTPESGYYETSYRRNISRNDVGGSLDVLRQMQQSPGSELVRMADEARLVVETEYTWDRFVNTILWGLENAAKRHAG
jgi:glycosyltransferase involved in cell wall biosynthesis